MISSQVVCDHHKVFRAELVSMQPDGLDTDQVKSEELEDDQSEVMNANSTNL